MTSCAKAATVTPCSCLDQAAMDYLMSFPNATYTPFRDGRISTVKKVFLPIVLK